jgi:hypothetical protein
VECAFGARPSVVWRFSVLFKVVKIYRQPVSPAVTEREREREATSEPLSAKEEEWCVSRRFDAVICNSKVFDSRRRREDHDHHL